MKTELTKSEKTGRFVLALLVGVLIWGAAIEKESFSVDVTVPLCAEVEDGYVLLGSTSDSVTVRLTGSGLAILSHQINSPLAMVCRTIQAEGLRSFPAGVTIQLNASDIHPGGAISVSRIFPDQAIFTVDTVITRRVPVAVVSSDAIPCRFRLLSVEPDYVDVTGPSSVVSSMDSVATQTVDFASGQATASLASSGHLVAYSEDLVRILSYEPAAPVLGTNPMGAGY